MRFSLDAVDCLLLIALLSIVVANFWCRNTREWQLIWHRVVSRPRYIIALMLCVFYVVVGALDCIHFYKRSLYAERQSIMDVLLSPMSTVSEVSYSAPFATHSHTPELVTKSNGQREYRYQRLEFVAQHLSNPEEQKVNDILLLTLKGFGVGFSILAVLFLLVSVVQKRLWSQKNTTAWLTLGFIICGVCIVGFLKEHYHILGTDKIGRDVFYMAVKSIRTGLALGTITLLIMLPFAIIFGMCSGYFGGWVDDSIHYLYTTLSSIPGVLLIAATMLSFQSSIEAEPNWRLLILCCALGLTSWIWLCRMLRGETLKLRSMGFVESAKVLGVSHTRILMRHVLPNVMHIVIITLVLDFSGLVLAEAVLSYVGVGVDPTSFSWGNLINASRLDMAREPAVWWPLCGALVFMFVLVCSVNVLSDAVQEALHPKVT